MSSFSSGQPEFETVRPFADFRPHPEDPVTMETFDDFNHLSAAVYEFTGIPRLRGGDFYAESWPTEENACRLSLSRLALHNGLRLIHLTKEYPHSRFSLTARNDGVTPGYPSVPYVMENEMPIDRVVNNMFRPFSPDVPVSDTALAQTTEEISSRLRAGLFIAKKHKLAFPTVFWGFSSRSKR